MIKKRNNHFACIISPQDVVQQLENGFNHGDLDAGVLAAGVLAGLESNSDMYSYLSYYHYSLWAAS